MYLDFEIGSLMRNPGHKGRTNSIYERVILRTVNVTISRCEATAIDCCKSVTKCALAAHNRR